MSGRLFLPTPSVRISFILAHIGRKSFDLFSDSLALYWNHLGEKTFGPFGRFSTKVAFTSLGANQFARAS